MGGSEAQDGGEICILIADSRYCTAETKELSLIKNKQKKC